MSKGTQGGSTEKFESHAPPGYEVRRDVIREMVRKHFDIGVSAVSQKQISKYIDGDHSNAEIREALKFLEQNGVVENVDQNINRSRWRIAGTDQIHTYRDGTAED